MNTIKHPDVDYIRERLEYRDGVLYWRAKPGDDRESKRWNARYAGMEAGGVSNKGYVLISLDGKFYLRSRLVFAMHHGYPPRQTIDHINHDRTDDRIKNLRDVSHKTNLKNQSMRSTNKSGVTGVCWNNSKGKWHVQCGINGKTQHLGYFDCLDKATEVVAEARRRFGFSETHGAA